MLGKFDLILVPHFTKSVEKHACKSTFFQAQFTSLNVFSILNNI